MDVGSNTTLPAKPPEYVQGLTNGTDTDASSTAVEESNTTKTETAPPERNTNKAEGYIAAADSGEQGGSDEEDGGKVKESEKGRQLIIIFTSVIKKF